MEYKRLFNAESSIDGGDSTLFKEGYLSISRISFSIKSITFMSFNT